jgi:hypothetical protein
MLLYFAIFLFTFTFLLKEAFQCENFQCENQSTIDALKEYKSDPFENSVFAPECCPAVYSSSSGCLCVDQNNLGLLASRGGNRMLDPL